MVYDAVAHPLNGIDLCAINFFRIEVFTIAFLVLIGSYGFFLAIAVANKVTAHGKDCCRQNGNSSSDELFLANFYGPLYPQP